MIISQKEIQHIASLARLQLKTKEDKRYLKDLTDILSFVQQLKQLEGEKNVSNPQDKIRNIFRPDNALNMLDHFDPHNFFKKKALSKGYLKIPLIFSR